MQSKLTAHESRYEVPIVPVAGFSVDLRVWELFSVVRISIEYAMEYLPSLMARKVPIRTCRQFQSSTIRTEGFFQSWARHHNAIVLIQLFVGTVKKENVETPQRSVIHTSEVAFDETKIHAG